MTGEANKNHAALQVENLVVSYQKRKVLQRASMNVDHGEIVALMGQNGSGKTTLLKTIMGLISPLAGTIRFGGEGISGKETHKLARQGIGYLMQDRGIFPSLSINDHLKIAGSSRGAKNLKTSERLVWETFPRLEGFRNTRAGLLSGGERQMLAISMLLVQEARLWLLDEPSCGLAPNVVNGLMNCIAQVSRKRGVTVLLVEQNVREAAHISNRVMLLRNGAVEEMSEVQLIEDLREGRVYDDFLKEINRMVRVDQLRPLIQPQDAVWILKMLSSPSAAQRKLALDLSKRVANDPLVGAKLREMWIHEKEQSVVQSLLFALLNVEGLEDSFKRQMFEWIKQHWPAFIDTAGRWYGGNDRILDSIKQRTTDDSFLVTKYWIYLCCAVASIQREEARKFVNVLPCDGSDFAEEVRQFALAQF